MQHIMTNCSSGKPAKYETYQHKPRWLTHSPCGDCDTKRTKPCTNCNKK